MTTALFHGANRAFMRAVGESLVYRVGAVAPVALTAFAENPFAQVDSAAGPRVNSKATRIYVLVADLPESPNRDDDTIEYEGRQHKIANIEPDQDGGAWIKLKRI